SARRSAHFPFWTLFRSHHEHLVGLAGGGLNLVQDRRNGTTRPASASAVHLWLPRHEGRRCARRESPVLSRVFARSASRSAGSAKDRKSTRLNSSHVSIS